MSRWNYMKNGQQIPLTVKVEDTLPVGTEVDYDGQDIPEGWEEVNNKVVLYNSTTGNNGTITLSDNISNYDYLEIYFGDGDTLSNARMSYQKVDLSISSKIALFIVSADTGGTTYLRSRMVNISNNSISTLDNTRYSYSYTSGSSGINTSQDNRIYIYKVIGYKEV